jgi:hypothetical protein
MQRLHAGDVVGTEIQEGLACGDLIVGEAELGRDLLDFYPVEIQPTPPSPTAAVGWRL